MYGVTRQIQYLNRGLDHRAHIILRDLEFVRALIVSNPLSVVRMIYTSTKLTGSGSQLFTHRLVHVSKATKTRHFIHNKRGTHRSSIHWRRNLRFLVHSERVLVPKYRPLLLQSSLLRAVFLQTTITAGPSKAVNNSVEAHQLHKVSTVASLQLVFQHFAHRIRNKSKKYRGTKVQVREHTAWCINWFAFLVKLDSFGCLRSLTIKSYHWSRRLWRISKHWRQVYPVKDERRDMLRIRHVR